MVYLASQSPRRLALLRQLGLDADVLDVEVLEQRQPHEPAFDYVNRVAREKAGAGLLKVLGAPRALVLAADTEVILDEAVFGKPADAADAARMLRQLSGRTHTVVTVVWLLSSSTEVSTHSISEVRFAALGEAEMTAYLESGEWQGKAGGYAIQGRAATFIEHLSGSYSGVMGLPLFETARLLRNSGVTV